MKDLNIVLDRQLVGEMQKHWLKTMISDEIDDIDGTIDNEQLWLKGSKDEEEVMLMTDNIKQHNDYKNILLKMLEAVEEFDRYELEDK